MLPTFTVAGTPAATTQVVMNLFARNDIPTTASTEEELRLSATGDPGSPPFDQITVAMLLWSIAGQTGNLTGIVTEVDLEDLAANLDTDAARDGTFAYANLSQFLALNFVFLLSPFDPGASETSAAVVPMPPPLTMTAGTEPPVNFSTFTMVDATYEANLAAYFARLSSNYDYNVASDPLTPPSPALASATAVRESLAQVIFRDYFLMVAKSAVQSAQKLLQSFPHAIAAGDSLASIANTYAGDIAYTVQPGDTLYLIASDFDVPADAIQAANPGVNFGNLTTGTIIQVPPRLIDAEYVVASGDTLASIAQAFGVPAASIQAANPNINFSDPLPANQLVLVPITALFLAIAEGYADTAGLQAGTVLNVRGVSYIVQATDTLASIVAQFGLGDAVALVTLNQAAPILRVGATMQIGSASNPSFAYTAQAGDTLAMVAAYFLVRNEGPGDDPNLAWYQQTIVGSNPSVDFGQPLAAGTTLTVPVAALSTQGISRTGTTTYVTKAGDTLRAGRRLPPDDADRLGDPGAPARADPDAESVDLARLSDPGRDDGPDPDAFPCRPAGRDVRLHLRALRRRCLRPGRRQCLRVEPARLERDDGDAAARPHDRDGRYARSPRLDLRIVP